MSTQNIPFSINKKKITLNYLKSAVMGFLPGDSRTSSKEPWETSYQCSSQYSSNVMILIATAKLFKSLISLAPKVPGPHFLVSMCQCLNK